MSEVSEASDEGDLVEGGETLIGVFDTRDPHHLDVDLHQREVIFEDPRLDVR